MLKTILIITIFIPLISLAQNLSPNEELDILVSPENPKPNETISLRVISNLSNLDSFFISWKKDGVVEKSSVGETSYKTTVGELSESHTITVKITDDNGLSIQKTINIRPAKIDLIWEADSYTPFLYKGKGLASHQSEIKVVAIPSLVNTNGVRLSSKSLIYNWSLDGKIDKNQSGLGRDVFVFNGLLISRPRTVTLEARSQGGLLSARETLNVDFIDPEIVFYEENPLTGLKNNLSLTTGVVEGGESSFVVEPYFFSRKAYSSGFLNYQWLIDNRSIPNLNGEKRVVFSDNISGRSSISVAVSNIQKLLQSAKNSFLIIVNEKNNQ